jgi:hypothetical protein
MMELPNLFPEGETEEGVEHQDGQHIHNNKFETTGKENCEDPNG